MKVVEGPIQLEYNFNTDPENLWSALVEVDQMKEWFFDNIPTFKAEVGFVTSFPVKSGDRTFTHLWEIKEVSPQQSITYSWKYKEYPGDALLSIALMPEGEKTKLNLSLKVLEDFPDDIPEFKRESCIGGWNYFMGERLHNFLK